VADGDGSEKCDVKRKLNLKHESLQSRADSKELAGRLDSVKKFAEDEEENLQSVVGLMLNKSSKSLLRQGEQSSDSKPASLINDNEYQMETKKPKIGRNSSLERDLPPPGKYSPVFSSVNRRVSKIHVSNQLPPTEREVNTFGGPNPIQASIGRNAYASNPAKQPAAEVELASMSKANSSSSQLVQAILSHREKTLSKQQSFNSPRSLHEKLQMTSEKICSSLEKSSINQGRRKMVMLDEAGVSKQSLNFGPPNNTSSAMVKSQLSGALCYQTGSINNSSKSVTPIGRIESSLSQLEPEGPNSVVNCLV
jgi:hypothetical protein